MAPSVIPETGYGRSSGAKGSAGGDIFDRGRFRDLLGMNGDGRTYGREDYLSMLRSGPSPSVDDFDTVPNPINPHEQQQTFMQSLVEGNTREQSLMQTLFPEKSKAGAYKASINGGAQSMKRDASQVVKDGAKVSDQRMGAQADVKEAKENFQADWSAARNEALAAFQEVTTEMGIDPKMAAETMIADDAPGKASAVAYMASEAAFGAGTMATLGKAAYVNMELNKSEKSLSPEQQEQILNAMLERLKNPPAQSNDTRAEASTSGGAIEAAVDTPEGSGADWAAMEMDDLAELLQADPDGLDQPEMQELMDMEYELDLVEDNHMYVAEHYHETPTFAKMVHSAESGNSAMNQIIMDAQVVDSVSSGPSGSDLDAAKIALTGDSMAGVSGTPIVASSDSFDAKQVSTHFEASLVNEPDVQTLLMGDMANEFKFDRAGGGY